VVAGFAAAGLTAVIDSALWPHLWALYLLSAWFSKFYTAAPVKLAYRGWGEISVWLAFGPMAILVAAVSQGVGFHPAVLAAMPLTGISTLSILLLGQLIDLDADRKGGKLGVAARRGTRFTARLYLAVQIALVLNVLFLGLIVIERGWPIVLAAVPYLLLLPGIWRSLKTSHDDPDALKPVAGGNVQLHLLFTAGLLAGLLIRALAFAN
jgi:1,4-dihydroxy-2-naphthoate octaprenyltransferase